MTPRNGDLACSVLLHEPARDAEPPLLALMEPALAQPIAFTMSWPPLVLSEIVPWLSIPAEGK